MKNSFKDYWFTTEKGLLNSANYAYEVLHNIITDKYKIVFVGTKNWNKQVKVVRYYPTAPKNENICLTVRSI